LIDLSQRLIASLALCSFLCGVLLGVAYEIARLIRFIFTPSSGKRGARGVLADIVTFFTDLLFFGAFAFCGILITFYMCGGVFRGVVYLCMAFGVTLYRLAFGRMTAFVVLRLASILKFIIKKMIEILSLPIRAIKFLFVRIFDLTIGKIIGRIKEGMLVKRLDGLFLEDARGDVEPSGYLSESLEKGYKKEGRVSFGGKKDIR
jgi:hypothetical protein